MKIIQKEFGVSTRSRTEMTDVTRQVEAVVRETGIRNGDVVVFCPHTTAAITINENADPAVVHDMLMVFDEVIPRSHPGYRHDEGNSDAHCKSSLVGCSVGCGVGVGLRRVGTGIGVVIAAGCGASVTQAE